MDRVGLPEVAIASLIIAVLGLMILCGLAR